MGNRVNPYFNTAGQMTRSVLHGLLITAFAQGLSAGVGYRLTGIQGPVILGVLTGILWVVPAIGTAIVWVPLSVWLMTTGPLWKGMLLFAWDFVLVDPIDTVVRPILINNVTRVPLLLV
jgi:predicted PurR-regulated permease PerM